MLTGLLIVCAGAAIAALWRRDRRRADQRKHVFDECVAAFDAPRLSIAPDGYPRLSGRLDGTAYALDLIPDSLTIKRLPQLWLCMRTAWAGDGSEIAITARPRPDDFFSAADRLPHRIAVPDWLPQDLAIRGASPDVASWLAGHRTLLSTTFADPLVKELAFGPKGLRLIYRLAEGDRGKHLLFRQSHFEAVMTRALLMRLRDRLAAFAPNPRAIRERAA